MANRLKLSRRSKKKRPRNNSFVVKTTLLALVILYLLWAWQHVGNVDFLSSAPPASTTSDSSASVYATVPALQNTKDSKITSYSLFDAGWWKLALQGTSLHLDDQNNMLVFPKGISRVWIDVGVHEKSHLISNLQEHSNSDLFVLGFEPTVGVFKPCPHERCVTFFAACTAEVKEVTLNVVEGDGKCNSILVPNQISPKQQKTKLSYCTTQARTNDGQPKTQQVPGMPLHLLIQKIPSSIQVEYIQIDAQGYDLEVIKGALPSAKQLQVVSLEVMKVASQAEVMYRGQPTWVEIQRYLDQQGWIYVAGKFSSRGAEGKEANAFFIRKDASREVRSKVPYLSELA